jgi:hypothetical protein
MLAVALKGQALSILTLQLSAIVPHALKLLKSPVSVSALSFLVGILCTLFYQRRQNYPPPLTIQDLNAIVAVVMASVGQYRAELKNDLNDLLAEIKHQLERSSLGD